MLDKSSPSAYKTDYGFSNRNSGGLNMEFNTSFYRDIRRVCAMLSIFLTGC